MSILSPSLDLVGKTSPVMVTNIECSSVSWEHSIDQVEPVPPN